MFASSNVTGVVENAVKANNVHNVQQSKDSRVWLIALFVSVLLMVLLNILVGPFLWNNVLRALIPGLRKARWFDTLALAVLFALVVPH
jgi:hypothetical protein|tara:strand:+ start:65 stop:328 length:264 start_codon:yes stop_codon:yes gene_type:complete